MNLQGSDGLGLLMYLWSAAIELVHVSGSQLAVTQSMIVSIGTTGMTWFCITDLSSSSRLTEEQGQSINVQMPFKSLHAPYLLTQLWSEQITRSTLKSRDVGIFSFSEKNYKVTCPKRMGRGGESWHQKHPTTECLQTNTSA